jgi:hypothetical protein
MVLSDTFGGDFDFTVTESNMGESAGNISCEALGTLPNPTIEWMLGNNLTFSNPHYCTVFG